MSGSAGRSLGASWGLLALSVSSWLIVDLLYIIFTRFLPTTSNHFGIYKASRKVCIMLEVSLVLLGAYEIQCNADWIPKYPAGAQGFHPTKFIPGDLTGSLRSQESPGIAGSIYPASPYLKTNRRCLSHHSICAGFLVLNRTRH